MRKLSLLMVSAALALLAFAPTARAGTTFIGFGCDESQLAVTNPGTAWVSDGVLHVRGWTGVYDAVGDQYCDGTLTAVANFNLELATSAGSLWGTSHVDLDAFDGGYDGTWTAQWTTINPLATDATNIWVGRYTARGFGDLAGWQLRGDIRELNHLLTVDSGYAFLPGD